MAGVRVDVKEGLKLVCGNAKKKSGGGGGRSGRGRGGGVGQ